MDSIKIQVTNQELIAKEYQSIEQINVSSFTEALNRIPENSILISDIDGTILPVLDTLRIIVSNYIKPLYTAINQFGLRSTWLEKLYFDFTEKLTTHFRQIDKNYRQKSKTTPTYVSNRISKSTDFFHGALDFSFGTSLLEKIMAKAGINKVHFGLDRQTGGILAVEGSWKKLVSDLSLKIKDFKNENPESKIKITVIADNANIIGEFASEPKFLSVLIEQISLNTKISIFEFEGTAINIQKQRALQKRLASFIEH